MGEALPTAPYPYTYFMPAPYVPLLPGHPGMPLPHMAHCGSDGQLVPFPPGMPLPLPPQAADKLAEAQPAGDWGAAVPESHSVPGDEPGAQHEPEAAASEQQQQGQSVVEQPATERQQQPEAEQPAAQPQPAQPRKPFLAMLREACGAPPAATQPAGGREGRRRGAFDPAAAASELARRWHAAAPKSVPASSLPQPARSASPAPGVEPWGDRRSSGGGGVKPAALPQRGSSGSLGGGKPGKPSSGSSASSAVPSGRNSPANCGGGAGGAAKPVVVAVRAWSSDDSAADGQPKWRIQSAKHGAEAALQQVPESAGGASGR